MTGVSVSDAFTVGRILAHDVLSWRTGQELPRLLTIIWLIWAGAVLRIEAKMG